MPDFGDGEESHHEAGFVEMAASESGYDHLDLDHEFDYDYNDGEGADVWASWEDGPQHSRSWTPLNGLDLSGLDGLQLGQLGDDGEPLEFEYEYNYEYSDDDEGVWGPREDWRPDIHDYVGAVTGKDAVLERDAFVAVAVANESRQEDFVVQETAAPLAHVKKVRPVKVLIVGAGLGGLLLAQGLKKIGIASRVFSQDQDAFGAAWDDNDHRLAYRITLAPATLNALRHCLPPANFRALVYHTTTQLPGTPPALSKVPYIGRYLSSFFHGLIQPSPYSRPGLFTSLYLLPLLFPGIVASPLSTHLFGKTKSRTNASQSLSVTIKTLRAVLLAGLDVITPGATPPLSDSVSSKLNFHYFSSYAQSHKTHDAEFGLASVWNFGKAVVKVDSFDHSNNKLEDQNDGGRIGVVFEDGHVEHGDLCVDVREDVVGPGSVEKDLLWISGLFPLPEGEKSSLPQKLTTSAAIIRSNSEVVLYSAPKHIITAPPPSTPSFPGYTAPSRGPSRRVSYSLVAPRPSHSVTSSPSIPTPSHPSTPLHNDASPQYMEPPPRKPTRRISNKPLAVPVTEDSLSVSKRPSKDSVMSSSTTATGSLGTSPMNPRRAGPIRRPSLMSTRSRSGSLFRYGSVTTPGAAIPDTDKITHVHWRLCFRVGLLATHTTALFLKPNTTVETLPEVVVSTRGGDVVKKLAGELVSGWHEAVKGMIRGSVGVTVAVDPFGGYANRGVGELLVGDQVDEGYVVKLKAGPTSLKPFDAPHDTNISMLLSRIRDLAVVLEKSCSLTDIGSAPQIDSPEKLSQLLCQFGQQSLVIESREMRETAVQVKSDVKKSSFGVAGSLLWGWLKLLYRAVWL
ncbi:hypothetical protein BCR33DRAFT_849200, partial [Rhizoclosmatium globosum]